MIRHTFALITVTVVLTGVSVLAQRGATQGEWRSHGGDPGSTKYAPLDQISKAATEKRALMTIRR